MISCSSANRVDTGQARWYPCFKEVINLKETQKAVAKLAMKIAQAAMIRNANQTTCNIIFQPKVPEGLAKFKKVKQ